MKRFIKAAPLIIVSFIVGVFAHLAWARLYARQVSLCEIARNPAAYNDKLVRVEAMGYVSAWPDQNSISVYEPACIEIGAGAGVTLNPSVELTHDVDEFANSRTLGIRQAKVVVEGVFDEWATMGCFKPQFGIKNANMTLRSPVTSEPLPQRVYP
jgi:hypothetical protein